MTTALLVFGLVAVTAFLALMARIACRPYLVQVLVRDDDPPPPPRVEVAYHQRAPRRELASEPRVVRGAVTGRRDAK